MRLALEVTPLFSEQPSGIGRYARRLMEALVPLATGAGHRVDILYRWSQRRRRALVAPPTGTGWCLYHGDWSPPFPRVDLVHGLQARAPRLKHAAQVASVMDLTPFTNPGQVPDHLLERDRTWIREAATRCQVLLAISEATRRDCIDHLGVTPERVVTTHLGVGPEFHPRDEAQICPVLTRLGLPRDFLLVVGDLNPRKNLPRLVAAYAACAAARDLPLVLAGKETAGADEVHAAIAAHGVARRVRFLSYVTDEDLPVLYAAARGVCYPSLYEGFGFPIIEAMLSGVPVMTSNVSSCPEVAGDHAPLVDPLDVAAISDGITRLLARTAADHDAARAWAGRFTWEACARATLEAYALARQMARG
jgi:glycosyltransferase involved in cell wall biosynthesis